MVFIRETIRGNFVLKLHFKIGTLEILGQMLDLFKLFLARVCKSLIPEVIYPGFLKGEIGILVAKMCECSL